MSWQAVGAVSVMTGLVMFGCGTPTALEVADGIVGTWVWTEATGGLAGLTLTPASTGETRSLRLDGTSADFSLNGALERSARYRLEEVTGGAGYQIVYLDPGMPVPSQALELRADTLILADPCCDLFTWRWERVR